MSKKLTPAQIAAKIAAKAASQPVLGGNEVPDFMKSLIKDKNAITSKLDVPKKGEDEILAAGQPTDFWKLVKTFIENRQLLFKELLKSKVAAAPFDPAEIGFRYMVLCQVEDTLQEVIDRVENFAKIVEVEKREKQEQQQADAK